MSKSYEYVKNWRKRVKTIIIASMGGSCQICLYAKTPNALELHHIDPTKKEISFSSKTISWNSMCDELPKCILLCANCHREVHAGIADIPTEYHEFDISIANTLKQEMLNFSKNKKIPRSKSEIKMCIQERRNSLLNNPIDFSKKGWLVELSNLWGIQPSSAKKWLKIHYNDVFCDELSVYNDRKSVIHASDIAFHERGWSVKLGKLLGISPAKAAMWMRKNIPDFYYSDNVIKHKNKLKTH